MHVCKNRDVADCVLAVGEGGTGKQMPNYRKLTPTDLDFIRVLAEKHQKGAQKQK